MGFKLSTLSKFWFPEASSRVLALIRIFLGTALLYDTLSYISERHAMFGVNGLLGLGGSRRPYPTIVSFIESFGGHFSGLGISGLDFLFAIYLCAILFFLVGYLYRAAVSTVFIIFYYLNLRNYLVFDSGHSLALMFLFFLFWMPADRSLSLSAFLKDKNLKDLWKEKIIPSAWPLRAIQIQICIVYVSTFLFKMEGSTWRNGSAIYYATRLPVYTRPEVHSFFGNPSLMSIATYGTLALEGLFVFLIWNRRLRPWMLFVAIGFHLILERALNINIFQWVMIAGLLSFVQFREAKKREPVSAGLLQQTHGYTMVEVLLATGLSVVVAMFAGALIYGSLTMSDRTRENIETQNELNSINYKLRSLAGRAINVHYRGNNGLNNTSSSSALGDGYVRDFSFTRDSDDASGPNTAIALMYFNVESRLSAVTPSAGSIQPTAIFFRKPTRQASGKILISTGPAGAVLDPAAAQLSYEGVVGVVLKDAQADPKNILQKITMVLTIRYFVSSSSSSRKIWCPPAETAADCQGGAPYRDVEREIILSFDNNQREVQYQAFEFGNGVYYFDPVLTRQ